MVIIQYSEQTVPWSTGVNNNVVIIQLFTKHADQTTEQPFTLHDSISGETPVAERKIFLGLLSVIFDALGLMMEIRLNKL